MASSMCRLHLVLVVTCTADWGIVSPVSDTNCVEEDEMMSEVFSSLQGGVVVERHLAASGEQLRVVDAVSKSSRSDIVLHMHFNYRQFAENAAKKLKL